MTENTPSPCRNVCEIDDEICVGCGRTLGEIAGWGSMTAEQKQQALIDIQDREYPDSG